MRQSEIVALAAHEPDPIEQLAFSPEGGQLLCASRPANDRVNVSLFESGKRRQTWTLAADGSEAASPQLAWNCQGRIICIPPGRAAHALDLEAGSSRPLPQLGALRLAAWSASGNLLWTVQGESDIQAWAPADAPDEFTLVREFSTRSMAIVTGQHTITCLATSGEQALIGLDNGLLMSLDSRSDERTQVWPSHGNVVESLAVSGDVAAAGADRGEVSLFDAAARQDLCRVAAFDRGGAASVSLSHDAHWLVAASWAGGVRVWRRGKSSQYELYAALRESDGRRVWVQFHPARPWIAVRVEGERAAHLWRLDLLDGEIRRLTATR
jgi:WD40 repeat protein